MATDSPDPGDVRPGMEVPGRHVGHALLVSVVPVLVYLRPHGVAPVAEDGREAVQLVRPLLPSSRLNTLIYSWRH